MSNNYNVLLIQSYTKNTPPIFPIGLAYIITAVKDKHRVKVLDLNIESDRWQKLLNRIAEFKPDIVGISLRNVDSTEYRGAESYYDDFIRLLKTVKSVTPSTKIVVGGSGASLYSKQIMDDRPEIDILVYLEGIESFAELLENLDQPTKVKGLFVRRDGNVIFTGARVPVDFKNKVWPIYEFFELNRYTSMMGIGIQTKKGCHLKCIYCPYPFLNPKLILRDAKDVVDEMEFLSTKYGLKEFFFVDSVFNAPYEHAMNICREIINRNLQVRWGGWNDVKGFQREYVQLAMEAGCAAFPFSIDAYSDRSLKSMGKNYTLADIAGIVDIAKKIDGINIGWSFFIDPPGATVRDLFKWIWFLIKTKMVLNGKLKKIFQINRIRIEPNTRIYDMALKEKIITSQTNILKPVFYAERRMRTVTLLLDIVFLPLSYLIRFRRYIRFKINIVRKT